MDISYLMIACTSEALGVGLNTLKGQSYIKININDAPQVTYLGFRLHTDFLMVMDFAKRNGYAFQELTELNVRDLHLRAGTFTVEGDIALATWLIH